MSDTDKARVEAQLAELENRLLRIERDLDEPHDPDSSERAVQMEDDESLEKQVLLVTQKITSTRRALDRNDSGNYGQCVECGEEISTQRLRARPKATLCIACAIRV